MLILPGFARYFFADQPDQQRDYKNRYKQQRYYGKGCGQNAAVAGEGTHTDGEEKQYNGSERGGNAAMQELACNIRLQTQPGFYRYRHDLNMHADPGKTYNK